MTLGQSFTEVLAAARTGAEWAWRALYDDLAPSVLGYLRGRGVPDPEDALGEVFLQVVGGLGRFTGDESSFRSWVLTIAHRRAVDAHRRAARRPAVPIAADLLEAAGPQGDTEEEGLSRIEAARALEAIRSLSPDQQDVLLLRLMGGLTTEEIARIVGKKPGAVKALQRRGLATLRRKISGEGVSE